MAWYAAAPSSRTARMATGNAPGNATATSLTCAPRCSHEVAHHALLSLQQHRTSNAAAPPLPGPPQGDA
eukprot:7055829-Alexandrium_andersonii.AAC.1